jgi:transposase
LLKEHTEGRKHIANAYRSAWHIEQVFRQMKNPDHLSVRPMWHWTDSMTLGSAETENLIDLCGLKQYQLH